MLLLLPPVAALLAAAASRAACSSSSASQVDAGWQQWVCARSWRSSTCRMRRPATAQHAQQPGDEEAPCLGGRVRHRPYTLMLPDPER